MAPSRDGLDFPGRAWPGEWLRNGVSHSAATIPQSDEDLASHESRVGQPMTRRGWLENDTETPRSADYAGTNACAPSWDHVAAYTDCMVAFGLRLTNAQCDPGGVGRHMVESWLGAAVDRGMRLIVVSPDRADAPRHPNAEHVAIRPNTDTALLLACAHELLRQGHLDRERIERITTGFERLAAYIQGNIDGIAKSPAWAASTTGLSEAQVLDFANALNAPTCLINMGWSLQRASGGEQPYWMAIAPAAMTDQIGKPGGGFAFGMGSVNSVGQPVRRLKAPGLNQGDNPVTDFIPVAGIAHLLDNPGGTLEYNGQTLDLPDIRMVYWAGGNPFHHHQDLNRLRRAWGKSDIVIVHEPVWTATAKHADIVLPSTLPFERDDIVVSSQDRTIVHNQAVTTAHGEARDDHAICAAIAAKLGLKSAFSENRTVDGWLRHWIEPAEWLGSSQTSRYPLHLLSPQPANRLHSQPDSVGASQRDKIDGREVATLARADAEARNIQAGDTIRLFNDRGACLAGAAASDTLMPGVIVLPTGAWYTPDDPHDPFALDLAGNPNVLTRDAGSSRVSQGPAPNSCLVEVEIHAAD